MTKAEATIVNLPGWPWNPQNFEIRNAHNREYTVRIYTHANGHKLECDNYFGDSILVINHGTVESPFYPNPGQNVEHIYDSGVLESVSTTTIPHDA